MTDYLQTFLLEHLEAAGFISILLNILISITGVFPSAPLTFVNVKLFGFWNGFSLSFIGEVLDAALSFWLYRKSFHTLVHTKTPSHSKWLKLLRVQRYSFLLAHLGKFQRFLLKFIRFIIFHKDLCKAKSF
ncbi:hypothetical protein ABEY43_11120 [Priestia megaterium]|uniref:hypothetical protein n=1 Tax=Priestia megaterium TaxID=1404 RepID=UPI002E204678|nr:hypothetical protein [Priestia megaterium]